MKILLVIRDRFMFHEPGLPTDALTLVSKSRYFFELISLRASFLSWFLSSRSQVAAGSALEHARHFALVFWVDFFPVGPK